jgi:DNA mismatch repair protein MutS2
MREFIRKANPASLFLIDEFGTGTDPALGGALAESILEELNFRKAIGIVTTHYMNLKVLADRTSGIINGSMAFDARKLEPLFRLEVGKPGSSYTFVVAERSGLPLSVVQRARKKVKKNTLLLEELLYKLEQEKSEVVRLMATNKTQEKKLRELVDKYEKNVVHQERKLEADEERVRQKELRLTRQFEDKFTRFVRDWKETKNKKAVLEKYSRSVQSKREQLSEKDQVKLEEVLAYNRQHLRKGSQVRLRNGRVTGSVENVREDKVTVLSGSVRTVVAMQDLVLIEPEKKKKPNEDSKEGEK